MGRKKERTKQTEGEREPNFDSRFGGDRSCRLAIYIVISV